MKDGDDLELLRSKIVGKRSLGEKSTGMTFSDIGRGKTSPSKALRQKSSLLPSIIARLYL